MIFSISIAGKEFDVTDGVSEWPGEGCTDRQLHEMLWTERDRIDAERRSEMRQMRVHAINSMCVACVKKEGE